MDYDRYKYERTKKENEARKDQEVQAMSELPHEQNDPEHLRRREELLNELRVGEVRRGVVSHLANFGAFVDLGGAQGLAHISQIMWGQVNRPSEILHIGQEVEVQVLSVDKEKKKIALSIKWAEIDPWLTAEQRYTTGQIVTGVVTKIAPFGAFVRIEDGIEGLLHFSEMRLDVDPKTVLHEGAQLQLRILRIDAERRRLGLSLHHLPQSFTTQETLCPECSRANSLNWKYCTYCGTSLERVCPKCGVPRPKIEGVRFCFECGCQLEE